MNPIPLPAAGGCRCGSVRFEVTAQPWLTSVCHCRGCQKMTGSAFATTATIPTDGFAVTSGATVVGGMRARPQHNMCPDCMSWVYTSFGGKVVNIRATMFDDPSWFAPFIEVQCAEKLPWAETRARYAFDREPDSDAFSAACDEYEALIDSKEH